MSVGFRGNVAPGSIHLTKSFPHNLHPFGSYCTEKILPVSPVAVFRPEADRSLSQRMVGTLFNKNMYDYETQKTKMLA